MAPVKSIKELCEFMWHLENKYHLLEYEVKNVKIWQYCRMFIYYKLSGETGLFNEPHQYNASLKMNLTRLLSFLKGVTIHNPLCGNYRVDTVIIPHPRSKFLDEEYIDIYTKYFVDSLIHEKKKFLVIERSFEEHKRIEKPYIKYFEIFSLLGKLKIVINKIKINNSDKRFLDKVQDEINSTLMVSFDLIALLEYHLNLFITQHKLFKILFAKRKTEKVYVVVSYAYGAMIKAAKDMGVEVIEIQHGVISEYHLGYSYPNTTKELDYFPDKLLCWGDFWRSAANYPIAKNNVIEHGFVYFNKLRLQYKINKEDNQIVILSQGSIGEKLMAFLCDMGRLLSSYKIIYKLHPGEYSTYKSYNSAPIIELFDNIKIVTNVDMYKILAESEYQIGVNSTAIYEGLGFDCKTVLLELPGVEYMDVLIKNHYAVLCSTPQLILSKLEEVSNISKKIKRNVFFAS